MFRFLRDILNIGGNVSNVLDHKCPNCDAQLKFNPTTQSWICEYCKSEYHLEDVTNYNKKVDNVLENDSCKTLSGYICKNCGASIIVDENVSATSCIYCKNTAILKSNLEGIFNPDYIIPFKYTKEDAINAFKKIGKGKVLMPKEFSNQKNINETSGIYIPFWLYSYEVNGEIEADCKRITTWRSGDYRYTKTDSFIAHRSGNVILNNIPVDGSKRFSNDIMNSIEPFDYKEMQSFNFSFLSGFLSEKYDVSKKEAEEDAKKRASNTFIDAMKNDIVGYNTVIPIKDNINLNNKAISYALLPVWLLNIKYKNKIYTFAMNGQTGKIVGNIPIDIKKAIFIWVTIFVIVFFILLGLSSFGVIS